MQSLHISWKCRSVGELELERMELPTLMRPRAQATVEKHQLQSRAQLRVRRVTRSVSAKYRRLRFCAEISKIRDAKLIALQAADAR